MAAPQITPSVFSRATDVPAPARASGGRPPRSARIASLDVLRGVGILGMLLTHIQSFSSVTAARVNPTVTGDLDGLNGWIWLGTYLLADGKFTSIFAMLFGATIGLLASRPERAGMSAAHVHYRRMAILFVIGLLHAHLLWYGDILASMAICGGLAFFYLGLPPARLIAAGITIFAVAPVLSILLAWTASSPEFQAQAMEYWNPSAEAIAWEVSRYRGGWLEQMDHRIPAAFVAASSLARRGLWQLTGLALVGYALLRLRVLTAERSARLYAAMAAFGFGLGVPVILYGVSRSFERGWDLHDFRLVGDQVNYLGSALVAFGWVGAVMLACRMGLHLRPLAAVGRMAMTNYLMQTLICTTIFYGHGLGLFGQVDRLGQLAIVAGIWAFQLVLSPWWFERFALGPMEWAWRCATYGRWVPIRVDR